MLTTVFGLIVPHNYLSVNAIAFLTGTYPRSPKVNPKTSQNLNKVFRLEEERDYF
jgi:hypothetical protein